MFDSYARVARKKNFWTRPLNLACPALRDNIPCKSNLVTWRDLNGCTFNLCDQAPEFGKSLSVKQQIYRPKKNQQNDILNSLNSSIDDKKVCTFHQFFQTRERSTKWRRQILSRQIGRPTSESTKTIYTPSGPLCFPPTPRFSSQSCSRTVRQPPTQIQPCVGWL